MRLLASMLAAAALALPSLASAQETVDIGTIKDEDIVVVQRLLFPKDDRTEIGVHLAAMPFDAYLFTPALQFSFDKHMGEKTSLSVLAGGGYGLENATAKQLQGPGYGSIPDAHRYLGSVLVGIGYAPIYAKANIDGARIVHHDLYGVARAGVTFESSIIQDGGFSVSPTLSLGVGARVFAWKNTAVRLEARDDMMLQRRSLTQTTFFKQNAVLSIGLTKLSAVKQRVR